MPFISILLPACNMGGKMDNCINSLKAQTFDDFEMIFVDDGSTDSTYEELTEFAKIDSRVRIIQHGENKSLLAARYTAMKEAKGEYIIFLDTDDAIDKDACKTLFEYVKDNPVDIVSFGFRFEPAGNELMPTASDNPLSEIYHYRVFPAIWKNCYSRSVIEKAVSKGESFYCNMGEDSYMSTILFANAKTFGTLEKVLLYYDAGTGMSNAKDVNEAKINKAIDSVKASTEHILAYISKYNPEYLEDVKAVTTIMFRFLLRQHVYMADNDINAKKALELFNREDLMEYYNYGCEVVIPARNKFNEDGTPVSINIRQL